MDYTEWSAADTASRATQEYLDTLNDAGFGAATPVKPKAISPADPAARLTGANGNRPFFAYSTNHLVDLDNAVIIDVEATAPIRQAEVGAVRDMLMRARDRFDLHPGMLAADTAYGPADMLGWLVEEQDIERTFLSSAARQSIAKQSMRGDKSERKDAAFPATDFTYDPDADAYRCPGGRALKPYLRNISNGRPKFDKDGSKRHFAPPSIHPSGRPYRWRAGHAPGDVPLAPLPAWLLGIGADDDRPVDHTRAYWRKLVADGIDAGQRNSTVASLTGHLLWHGVDPEVALELMLAWNRMRCRPPLSDEEVARTVHSIERTHERSDGGTAEW